MRLRIIEKLLDQEKNIWNKVRMEDLKQGDLFRMFENEETMEPVVDNDGCCIFFATSDPYKKKMREEEEEVFTIQAEGIKKLQLQ